MSKSMTMVCIIGMCAASMASAMSVSTALSERGIEANVIVVSQPSEGLDLVISEFIKQDTIELTLHQLNTLEVGVFDVGKLQASLIDNQNPVLPNSATRHPAMIGVLSPTNAKQKIDAMIAAGRVDKPGGHLRL